MLIGGPFSFLLGLLFTGGVAAAEVNDASKRNAMAREYNRQQEEIKKHNYLDLEEQMGFKNSIKVNTMFNAMEYSISGYSMIALQSTFTEKFGYNDGENILIQTIMFGTLDFIGFEINRTGLIPAYELPYYSDSTLKRGLKLIEEEDKYRAKNYNEIIKASSIEEVESYQNGKKIYISQFWKSVNAEPFAKRHPEVKDKLNFGLYQDAYLKGGILNII